MCNVTRMQELCITHGAPEGKSWNIDKIQAASRLTTLICHSTIYH